MAPSRLWPVLVVVGLGVGAWSALGVGARADHLTRTTADEPQYLLTAISLAEDRDLSIRDELRAQRYLPFHEAALPPQTTRLPDGRRVSPHDPLLPVLLAGPVAVAGAGGAKLALSAVAGALAAAMVWVAVRRFAVSVPVAAGVVVAFGLAAPLAAYGTQVYPELPAALAVTVAIGAVAGPLRRRGLVVLVVALVALPWLAVKYLPVVAALAAVAAWRLWRADRGPTAIGLAGVLTVGAVGYLAVHQVLYGGFTPYAAGDHFTAGELSVMGHDPDHLGRSWRLLGLLVDRTFGLAAWAPLYLLAVPALAALARRRPPGALVLGAVLAAAWVNATFVALTMHGWWWPGRQVVVALPAVVLAVAWWADRVRWARVGVVVAGALSALTWAWLLADVHAGRVALVVDFAATTAPTYRVWHHLLPDGAALGPGDVAGFAGWLLVLVGLGVAGWHSVRPASAPDPEPIDATPAVGVMPSLGLTPTIAPASTSLVSSDDAPRSRPPVLRHPSLTPGGTP